MGGWRTGTNRLVEGPAEFAQIALLGQLGKPLVNVGLGGWVKKDDATAGQPVNPDLANVRSRVEVVFKGRQGAGFKGNANTQASGALKGNIQEIGRSGNFPSISYDYQIRNPARRYGLG
jgi:hypothetical protein